MKNVRKTRKTFNLIYSGTGIRYHRSDENVERSASLQSVPFKVVFALFIVIVTGILLARQELDEQRYNSAFVPSVEVKVSSSPILPPALPPDTAQSVNQVESNGMSKQGDESNQVSKLETAKDGPIVRFGVFISGDNANRLKDELANKGIFAEVKNGVHQKKAFLLKAGPIINSSTEEMARNLFKNFPVALSAPGEPKYLIVGPIWLKQQGLYLMKSAEKVGLITEMTEEQRNTEIFKVVSAPFSDVTAAAAKVAEWRGYGLECIIER